MTVSLMLISIGDNSGRYFFEKLFYLSSASQSTCHPLYAIYSEWLCINVPFTYVLLLR